MLTKAIYLKYENLKMWRTFKQMAMIAIELFKRNEAKHNEDNCRKWAIETHRTIQDMIDTDHALLTKLFLEFHKKDIAPILETYHKIIGTG